jgi:hypothetical protein
MLPSLRHSFLAFALGVVAVQAYYAAAYVAHSSRQANLAAGWLGTVVKAGPDGKSINRAEVLERMVDALVEAEAARQKQQAAPTQAPASPPAPSAKTPAPKTHTATPTSKFDTSQFDDARGAK